MVTMLPDYISPDVKSQAEKHLFDVFRRYHTDDRFIILHSLGMSEHVKKVYGEIDYVIVCAQGVLCVEVKGGAVRRNDGLWEYQNRYGHVDQKESGPFQQVVGNMFTIQSYLKRQLDRWDPIAQCQFASCVMMPDCCFTATGPDITKEILFDKSINWDLEDVVEQSFKYWRDQLIEKHGICGGSLSNDDIERVANILRGDFNCVPMMKDIAQQVSKQLDALTEDQYYALSGLARNPRVLITGMAGSGKTVLAMEEASKAYWAQKKVLYLCYNRNIAAYVRYCLEYRGVYIDVRTLHSLMMDVCDVQWDENMTSEFYSKTLPEKFLETDIPQQYDQVIVDEGQDLLTANYMKCINRLVVGGLQTGNWSLFYDPNQNIFQNGNELNDVLEQLRLTNAVEYELRLNCRNTKEIADMTTLLTDMSQPERAKVSSSCKPVLIRYTSSEDERNKLIDVLTELRAGGLTGKDIVVLSQYRLDNPSNCMHGHLLPAEAGVLRDHGNIWEMKPRETLVTTISAFKGLEAKAVVVMDINKFSSSTARLLNYVALSRAKVYLYILYNEEAEDDRQNLMMSGYFKLNNKNVCSK